MAKANNSSSGGSVPKKDKYDKIPADIAKEMINSRNEAARGYNMAGKIVLATAFVGKLASLSGKATGAAADRAGAQATSEALKNSTPTTSKTLNVPKGTNVISSNESGMARTSSDVAKVTIQKNPVRVQAGIKANATIVGEAASKASLAASAAKAQGAVAGATIVQGIHGVGKKKKK